MGDCNTPDTMVEIGA